MTPHQRNRGERTNAREVCSRRIPTWPSMKTLEVALSMHIVCPTLNTGLGWTQRSAANAPTRGKAHLVRVKVERHKDVALSSEILDTS